MLDKLGKSLIDSLIMRDERELIPGARYEVRCCCQPQKVLGTLPWPSEGISMMVHVEDDVGVRAETIELREMSIIRDGMREMKLAVYSEDRGIEFWRQLEGFEEAKGNE